MVDLWGIDSKSIFIASVGLRVSGAGEEKKGKKKQPLSNSPAGED